MLKDELLSISTRFGGSTSVVAFRIVVAAILVIGMQLLGQWWEQTRQRIVLGPLFLAIALLVVIFWLPFRDWFAGFAVVRGDASFIVRYGAEISFLGLVIGVIAFAGWLISVIFFWP